MTSLATLAMAPSVLFVADKVVMQDKWHCHHLLVKGGGFCWVPGARMNIMCIHVRVSFEILLVLNLYWGYNWTAKETRGSTGCGAGTEGGILHNNV
jgi:hypothetical protein